MKREVLDVGKSCRGLTIEFIKRAHALSVRKFLCAFVLGAHENVLEPFFRWSSELKSITETVSSF